MQRGCRDIISTNIISMYPSFYELSFLWDKDSTCKVSTVQSLYEDKVSMETKFLPDKVSMGTKFLRDKGSTL